MMEEIIEGIILPLAAFVIGIVIYIAVSTKKDHDKTMQLEKYLNTLGFIVSCQMEIPDMARSACPFMFMADFKNKKWIFANYRSNTAEIYDFSEIIDYRVILRSKGTKVLMGKQRILSSAPDGNGGVLQSEALNSDNCEYIAIEWKLQGKSAAAVPTKIVMYECQDSDGNLRRSDFIFPQVCIDNAIQLEQWLHEIQACKKGETEK